MRLIGARFQGVDHIATPEGDHVRLLAPLQEFYQDTSRALATSTLAQAPLVPAGETVAITPVPATAKVLCVGLNYRAHAAEAGETVPEHPTVFGRWAGTLCPPGTEVAVLPDEKLDWEAELAAIVGMHAYRVSPDQAAGAILGYTAFNDLSARDYQLRTSQWTLGKNVDRSGPIGPEVVTSDELGPVRELGIRARVNGETVQDASCGDMIFSAEQVLSYVSGALRLVPGDVLALGTPAGVGWVRTPAWFLAPGDTVEVEIDRIGVLRNSIVGPLEPVLGHVH